MAATKRRCEPAPTAADARVVEQRKRVRALRQSAHIQQQHVVRRIVSQDHLAEVHARARVRRACEALAPASWTPSIGRDSCAQRLCSA